VTVLGNPATDDATLAAEVKRELAGWFGAGTSAWRHLRTYRIHRALPDRRGMNTTPCAAETLETGLRVCGDHCENGSIQGALRSGRRTGEALVARFAGSVAVP
jgi:predicted NAD/FAD-dependent oxidoreductase